MPHRSGQPADALLAARFASPAAPSEAVTSNDSAAITIPISVAAKLGKPPPQAKPHRRCSVTRRGDRRANRLTGTEGSERLLGGHGADRIDGRRGADCLAGQHGDDVLIGGGGQDEISGGPGADRISARDGARDTIRCGPGRDVVTADRSDRVARDCERVMRG